MKILIIGPSWVGDLVMAQSLFITLCRQYENPQIDVLAPSWSAPILDVMPEVHQTIEMPLGHGELQLKVRKQLAIKLKNKRYDWAIVLPNSFKSALIPWLAYIPKRTGWRGEFRYGLLNDLRLLDTDIFTKTVQRYVGLAFSKGVSPNEFICPNPKLIPTDEHIKLAMLEFDMNLQKPILALCPGAEFGPAKKWPARYFQEVAAFHIQRGGRVCLFGSKNDSVVCNNIAEVFSAQDVKNFAGKTSLQQAVALLSQVDQVVTNDSGLMHVAAALERPVVAVYGGTSEHFTPPLSSLSKIVYSDIDCRPCHKRTCPYGHYDCLEEIKPEQVIEALKE